MKENVFLDVIEDLTNRVVTKYQTIKCGYEEYGNDKKNHFYPTDNNTLFVVIGKDKSWGTKFPLDRFVISINEMKDGSLAVTPVYTSIINNGGMKLVNEITKFIVSSLRDIMKIHNPKGNTNVTIVPLNKVNYDLVGLREGTEIKLISKPKEN